MNAGTACFVMRSARSPKFLMTQRAPGLPGEGLWSVPGGRIEKRESWQGAMRREVREETGLGIEQPRLLAVTTAISGEWLTVWGRQWSDDLVVADSTEVAAWEWVTLEQAQRLPLWLDHWTPLLQETGGWRKLELLI